MTIGKMKGYLWTAVLTGCLLAAALPSKGADVQPYGQANAQPVVKPVQPDSLTTAQPATDSPDKQTAAAPETAAQPDDGVTVSLLTCAAGEEIYSLFGHSAIRVEIPAERVDMVYNYGIFDFNAPNFILRFALGKTDYQLGRTRFDYFAAEYAYLGRTVWQQTLNLTSTEKEKLLELLRVNYLPQNRIYRYNFFYDNCATRPRDLVERCLDGKLAYDGDMTDVHTGTTFRDLLHYYSIGHPWSRFGMDLCMGPKADREISRRTMMFVPFHVQKAFGKAEVADADGSRRPLVKEERVLVPVLSTEAPGGGFTPLQAALLLLVLTLAVTLLGYRLKRPLWGVDAVLFAAAGVAGCILAFLAICSEHPAVSPNYLLFVFHPLHLLCLPCALRRVAKHKLSRYMVANAIVLTLFILLWAFIPQRFPMAVLPLALCLWIRSMYHILFTR